MTVEGADVRVREAGQGALDELHLAGEATAGDIVGGEGEEGELDEAGAVPGLAGRRLLEVTEGQEQVGADTRLPAGSTSAVR